MLRVDQRPFKAALQKCLTVYEKTGDLGIFVYNFRLALIQHDHYLHVDNVREMLVGLLDAGNLKRARQFVSHLPDTTASRPVVAFRLGAAFLVAVFVLALVAALAVFLWQHFFG